MWAISGMVEYQTLSGCAGNLRCLLLVFSCNTDHSLGAECHHFFISSNDELQETHSSLEACFFFFFFGNPSPNLLW